MTRLGTPFKAALAGAITLCSATAAAQTFPADADYIPMTCGDEVMTDGFADEPTALGPRDLVGDTSSPTGLRGFDADFLYLRIRVEDDPTQGTALQPFSWGVEFDLDGDLTTYELLALVDGVNSIVSLFENNQVMQVNDPSDPADMPPLATYDVADNAQVIVAADSNVDGTPDFFVDMALPWADLEPAGLSPASVVSVWVASSSTANSLDGDFACHDGPGLPSLTDAASDPTVIDPTIDTDGDGFTDEQERDAGTDPNDPNDFPTTGGSRLAGGGGCNAAGSGSGAPMAALLLLLLAAIGRRDRRSRAR